MSFPRRNSASTPNAARGGACRRPLTSGPPGRTRRRGPCSAHTRGFTFTPSLAGRRHWGRSCGRWQASSQGKARSSILAGPNPGTATGHIGSKLRPRPQPRPSQEGSRLSRPAARAAGNAPHTRLLPARRGAAFGPLGRPGRGRGRARRETKRKGTRRRSGYVKRFHAGALKGDRRAVVRGTARGTRLRRGGRAAPRGRGAAVL